MFLDSATVEANFQRFIKRVVDKEKVFYLSNDDGVANSTSHDDDEQVILLFWSDAGYARRVIPAFECDFEVADMTLFDFLYLWLPGMTGDGVLAGVNWNQDLVGREIDPFELREQIQRVMPDELLSAYDAKCEALRGNND